MKINGLDKYKGEPLNLDLGADITKITSDYISAMKMSFSEKKKLEEQYLAWCEEQNKEIKGGKIDKNSFINVISFLESIGWDNVNELKKENDKLKERLKTSLEMPCEIGTHVYTIHETDIEDKFNPWIDKGRVVSISFDNKLWIYVRYNSGLTMWYSKDTFEKEVFPNFQSAELYREELEERRNER